jgi:Tfp pilus assembly protein PilO
MIRNVAQAQQRLVVVIACLAIVDVAALAFLLSPAIHSNKRMQAELQTLQGQLAQKHVQAIPALDMDKKLVEAKTQISDFYAQDFPSRYSEISQALATAAHESQVQLTNITYAPVRPNADQVKLLADRKLTEINLTLDMTGNYESEIRFINAMERSKLLLVLESVNLAESQGGSIRLSLRMQTYLRTTGREA